MILIMSVIIVIMKRIEKRKKMYNQQLMPTTITHPLLMDVQCVSEQ